MAKAYKPPLVKFPLGLIGPTILRPLVPSYYYFLGHDVRLMLYFVARADPSFFLTFKSPILRLVISTQPGFAPRSPCDK